MNHNKGNSYTDEEWLLSNNFSIHNLCRATKLTIDKLEGYEVDPLSKSELKFYIVELIKNIFRIEEFCNAVYNNYTDDEIEKIDKKDIERNLAFLTEGRKDDLKTFYHNKIENENRIYERAEQRITG